MRSLRMSGSWPIPSNVPRRVVIPSITPKLLKTSTSGAAFRVTASKNVAAKPVAGNASTLICNPRLVDSWVSATGTVASGVSPVCGEPIFQIRIVSSVAAIDTAHRTTVGTVQVAIDTNGGSRCSGGRTLTSSCALLVPEACEHIDDHLTQFGQA